MKRLEAGEVRRKAFRRMGGPRLYALYCEANPEWAQKAEALMAKNAEAARWRKEACRGLGSCKGFCSQCEIDPAWGKKARRLLKKRPRKPHPIPRAAEPSGSAGVKCPR